MKILNCEQQLSEHLVGGKFAKQAKMKAHGIPVPKFFCLSKTFYENVWSSIQGDVTECLKEIDFSNQNSIRTEAKNIEKIFSDITLSESDRSAIFAEFDRHFSEQDLVSVRASTVGKKLEESEDGANNPFAGMSESFLYVRRDQIIEKILLCWASGYSEESLMYRHAEGFDLTGFSVAVGVQKMVMGCKSFVMFTCDPKTAAKDTVVVAGYGIGEGVVQESVPVDHYFISGKTSEISSEIATKDSQLSLDTHKGFGLTRVSVEESQHNIACLNQDELTMMTDLGRKIESLFGCPQDTEGCFTEDGELYFLQSRPIALDYSRQLVFSNTNVTESFPGVTTALTYSFARFFYREIFYDMYRRLGVKRDTLRDNFEPLDKMVSFIGGRIYYCLTAFYLLHSQSPLFPIFRKHWENMIGLRTSYQTQSTSRLSELWKKTRVYTRFATTAVYVAFDFLTHNKKMQRFHDWWENLISPHRGKSFVGEDPYVTMQTFTRVWREVGNEWGVTLTTDAYMIPLYGWVEVIFSKWGLDEDPGLLSDLLCGDEKLQSVEILLSAVRLAEFVRSDGELAQQFSTLSSEDLLLAYNKGELGEEFNERFDYHLHYYGDRGLQELKLEVPSVRDNPIALLRNIKQFASQTVDAANIAGNEAKVREEADKKLAKLLSGKPVKFFVLTQLLNILRRLISHRENSRYCRSELFGFSKSVFKGIADHLVKQGALTNPDDVFHLTQDEIFGYVDGSGTLENLQVVADVRKSEYQENLTKTPKDDITTLGAVRSNALFVDSVGECDTDGIMKGLGSSAGKTTGRAKVVLDPMTVDGIEDDEILIARETDPGWLFLMLGSAGMVVERGSMLSHTAITGRKFGIPTVVAVENATTAIPDGALIEIDGSTGIVKVLEVACEQAA